MGKDEAVELKKKKRNSLQTGYCDCLWRCLVTIGPVPNRYFDLGISFESQQGQSKLNKRMGEERERETEDECSLSVHHSSGRDRGWMDTRAEEGMVNQNELFLFRSLDGLAIANFEQCLAWVIICRRRKVVYQTHSTKDQATFAREVDCIF